MTDVAAMHRAALAAMADLVDGVGRGRWAAGTPCDGWNVRTLVNHVAVGNLWAVELAGGRTIDAVGSAFDGDQLGAAPSAAFRASADAAAAAFEQPGAMEVACAVSYGPVPGEVYAGHRFLDVLVHGWDLAQATGQRAVMDAALVEACWAIVEPQAESFRRAGALGPAVPVPAGADRQEQLLGLLGRRA